ncbi:MAG: hypothetical protein OXC53_07870 [Rhodobacteraceae bacterium]|nr:hypothetical protein [Paracoccaceae bacterium]
MARGVRLSLAQRWEWAWHRLVVSWVQTLSKLLTKYARLPRQREKTVLAQTVEAFSTWHQIAKQLNIPKSLQDHVLRTLRLNWT